MIERVERAQRILTDWLEEPVTTFVPPGLQFPYTDYAILGCRGLTTVIRAPDPCRVWHDRDFVVGAHGYARFRRMLRDSAYTSVRAWAGAS